MSTCTYPSVRIATSRIFKFMPVFSVRLGPETAREDAPTNCHKDSRHVWLASTSIQALPPEPAVRRSAHTPPACSPGIRLTVQSCQLNSV